MLRSFLLIIAGLVLFISPALAQKKKPLLPIPQKAASINGFIPAGYDTLQVTYGDLNKDGMADAVVAIKQADESKYEIEEEPARLLLILFKEKGGYKQAGKSATVLMCLQCGGVFGDPFSGIEIEKGILYVNHYGGSAWRWSETQKFRYQNGGFYLIGSTSDFYFNASDCNGEGVGEAGRNYKDINWVTGDREIIEKTDDCKLIKHIKDKIKVKSLVRLEAY